MITKRLIRCFHIDSEECIAAQKMYTKCKHGEWHNEEEHQKFVCRNMYRGSKCLTSDKIVELRIEQRGW